MAEDGKKFGVSLHAQLGFVTVEVLATNANIAVRDFKEALTASEIYDKAMKARSQGSDRD